MLGRVLITIGLIGGGLIIGNKVYARNKEKEKERQEQAKLDQAPQRSIPPRYQEQILPSTTIDRPYHTPIQESPYYQYAQPGYTPSQPAQRTRFVPRKSAPKTLEPLVPYYLQPGYTPNLPTQTPQAVLDNTNIKPAKIVNRSRLGQLTPACQRLMASFIDDLLIATAIYNKKYNGNYYWLVFSVYRKGAAEHGKRVAIDINAIMTPYRKQGQGSPWHNDLWQPFEILRAVAKYHDLLWGGTELWKQYPHGDLVHVECNRSYSDHQIKRWLRLKPKGTVSLNWRPYQLEVAA